MVLGTVSVFYFALPRIPFAHGQIPWPPLVITEVMYDPAGEDSILVSGRPQSRQWIEIYNQSSLPITILGGIGEEVWTFLDSTGTHFFAKTPARGTLTVAPQEYIVLAGDAYVFQQEYPWYTGTVIDVRMELQHQYDFVQIKNDRGEVMAQALWSYNIGGQGNGKTLEFYSRDDVRESVLIGGTPGQPNIPQNPTPLVSSQSPLVPRETITTEPYPHPLSVGKVIINELLPGNEYAPGWIELRNLEPYPVDIQGWKIKNLEKSFLIPTTTVVNAYEFLVIDTVQPSASGDVVQLYNNQGVLLFEVEYRTPIPGSWSVARFPAGWAITTTPTKSRDNTFSVPKTPIKSPIITETHPTTYPTSTLLSQLSADELPMVHAFITALGGTVLFIIIKRKVIL